MFVVQRVNKSEEKLFLQCSTTTVLLAYLSDWCGGIPILATIDSLNSLIKSATRPSRTLKEVTRMEAIIYKFMCVLWSYRNYYIFSGKIKCTAQLVVKVKFISFFGVLLEGKG